MFNINRNVTLVSFLFLILAVGARTQQKPFQLQGIYLEGCSCKLVCACDLNGAMVPDCQVIGAMIISSGHYAGVDLSDVKMAFATADKWVRVFVQTKDQVKARTAAAMAQAFFRGYGTVKVVQDAVIELSGSNGNFTLTVNGGDVINLKTQPVLGADGKTAVTYTNYPDPLFQTIMQGRVVSGSYDEGKHHFTLKGSNSFFNQDWSVSGRI